MPTKKTTPEPTSSAPAPPPRRRAKGNDVAAATAAPELQAANDNGNGTPGHEPSHDEIAEAAYHRFLQRGGSDGDPFNDWLEAERELRQRAR
jgi:hypothetical protein